MSHIEKGVKGALAGIAIGFFSPAHAQEGSNVVPPQAYMTDEQIDAYCKRQTDQDPFLRNPKNKDIAGYRTANIDGCKEGSRQTRAYWKQKFEDERKERDRNRI